ncbi:MAG TPA: GNAT family N-acetyltransferase [Ignavibacteriaceae bacterium]|nr:GNAT family N-acetyltransferase [Ignavibacteriaceae bacterium]
MEFFLSSTRLLFRKWGIDDLYFAEKLWGNKEVTKYISANGKFSFEEISNRLKNEIDTQDKFGMQYWPVFLKSKNEFIGCCGLRPYNSDKNILELGVHILPEFWRKGYASEALKVVISYAFNFLKVSGLFAGHNPENEISGKLLIKNGFDYTHNEFYEPTGLNHPSYLLTKEKFINLNRCESQE